MELLYMVLASLGLLSIAAAAVDVYWWNKQVLRVGPPSYMPVLGHLLNFFLARKSLHRYLAGLARTYGPILFLRLGSSLTILISGPGLVREFLHAHGSTFADRPAITSAKCLWGAGGDSTISLLPYGEAWRHGRKLYSASLFSPHRIQDLQSAIISHEIHHLISTRLLTHDHHHAASPLVNLTACLDTLLESIVTRIVLRQRPSQLKDIVLADSPSSLTLSQLAREQTRLLVTPCIGDYVPWLRFLDHKTVATMRKWGSAFSAVIDQVLNERSKANRDADAVESDAHSSSTRKDVVNVLAMPENKMTRDTIKAHIAQLLAAGMETPNATLNWAFSEVLATPRVLAKLRAELDEVVGLDRCVHYSDIPQLPYMQAVVKETFRKHPPVPLFERMSSEACEVAGFSLPKGTRLIVNMWAIGHDPQVWKDPEVFSPERFLVSPNVKMDVKGHHFELIPFGSGKRKCPGMDLGMAIVQLTLSTLVHSLEWELPRGQDSIDMSERLGLMCNRVHPLLVQPPKPRLHNIKT